MRIIDILNKKAEKRLKDGERFVYENIIFIYNKKADTITSARGNKYFGEFYTVENILLNKVEFIRVDEEE